ncbi:MAG: hypothetical protein WCP12_11970 [bacterium]
MLVKFDFGTEMSNGFNLFKGNMGLLILVSFLASLLGLLTCTVLMGPLYIGVLLIIDRLLKKDDPPPQAGDLFKGFDFFLHSFLLWIFFMVCSTILAFIPVIGTLLSMALGTLLWWGFMFIAYENLTAIDAVKKVINETTSGNFFNQLLFALVANLIAGAGIFLCGVGALFTVPLSYCMMVCCYQATYGNKTEVLTPDIFLK